MNEFLEVGFIDPRPPSDVKMMNPLKLAFLGDAVYEAYVRTYIISKYEMSPHEMSKKAIQYVKASAQAYAVHQLKDFFSEEEWTLIKRGRNQKSGSVPKNAQLTDYRYATGYEALIGYLYLIGEKERIYEVVHKSIQAIDARGGVGNEKAHD